MTRDQYYLLASEYDRIVSYRDGFFREGWPDLEDPLLNAMYDQAYVNSSGENDIELRAAERTAQALVVIVFGLKYITEAI
jgi:hypothetical protein